MPTISLNDLQNLHESLVQRQSELDNKGQVDFIKDVQDYIEKARGSGSEIFDIQEREQIRATLRYWGNYVYSVEGIFPNTELVPSTSRRNSLGISIGMITFSILLLLFALVIGFSIRGSLPIPVTTLRPGIRTAVVQTLTAIAWTPAPTPTYNPNIPDMINWLNTDLSTISPLGQTLDAEYHVTNISFPNVQDSLDLIFRVDVRCICISGEACCTPERTFVVILDAMYRNRNFTLLQMPLKVSEVLIVCTNHQTKAQIGAMTASWQDVDAYLRGKISGYQLGARVTRTIAP